MMIRCTMRFILGAGDRGLYPALLWPLTAPRFRMGSASAQRSKHFIHEFQSFALYEYTFTHRGASDLKCNIGCEVGSLFQNIQ